MRRTFGERQAEATRRLEAEIQRLRARLPVVAAHLRARGATDVFLFGSLAEGRFREDSDVDLAVRGLDWRAALGESVRCGDLLDRHVDLVRLEDAAPSLVERVQECGVPLP